MPQTQPSSPTPQRQRPAGFTTIELLVVIGIIGVVAGILVVGLPYASAGLKKNQTETRLGQLRNGYAEFLNNKASEARLFSIVLPGIYFEDNAGKPAASPQIAENHTWVAVPASAVESLYRSGRVYEQLKSNPAFAAIFNDLPSDKKRTINFTISTKEVTTAPPDNNVVALEFPLDAWDNPILFVFDNLKRPVAANTFVPLTIRVTGGAGSNETATGGLTYIYSKAGTRFWKPAQALNPVPKVYSLATGRSTTFTEATPWNDPWLKEAGVDPTSDAATDIQSGGVAHALRAPDQMPFFVSAGPDGRFETHDDNVYSFGN